MQNWLPSLVPLSVRERPEQNFNSNTNLTSAISPPFYLLQQQEIHTRRNTENSLNLQSLRRSFRTATMESITTEYNTMRTRHKRAVHSTEESIDSMLQIVRSLKEQVNSMSSQNPSTPTSDSMVVDVTPDQPPTENTCNSIKSQLEQLHTASRALHSSLVSDHRSVGGAINKFGKAIDSATAPSLGDLCAPAVRLDTRKINDAIAAHLFREGMFHVGRIFLDEAAVALDDQHIRPFEDLYHILRAFWRGDLQPAISWTQLRRQTGDYTYAQLEFRLHRLAYIQILRNGDRTAALKYAKKHFSTFPEEIESVQKLMTCLLYVSALDQSPYKDMSTTTDRDDVERTLSREYCRAQGLAKDSSLLTVFRCGTKAIPTLLKASRVAPRMHELGMDDALPVEVDVGRECQFHSIFTCPVSKEEACEGNNVPMILPCGHVLSKQSMNKLPKGGLRFKCPYCPMEQVASECREIHI